MQKHLSCQQRQAVVQHISRLIAVLSYSNGDSPIHGQYQREQLMTQLRGAGRMLWADNLVQRWSEGD